MEYVKDDLVIVYLSMHDRTNDKKLDYKVCKVVVVGKHDLICETPGSFSKLFKVSKSRCVRLENKFFKYSDAKTVKPRIGDLVTSARDTFNKGRDTFTGIVENITYDPTTQYDPIYVVRIGQQTVRAYLENIIIIESAE